MVFVNKRHSTMDIYVYMKYYLIIIIIFCKYFENYKKLKNINYKKKLFRYVVKQYIIKIKIMHEMSHRVNNYSKS